MPDFLERLLDLLSDDEPLPNKLTEGVGKLVRQARDDAGLSQAQLAGAIYRRRATVSDIENGKVQLSLSTLALLSAALDKPITYFLPWFIYDNLRPEELTPTEQQLLIQFRKIWSEDLQRLAIRQVKQVADTDIQKHLRARRRGTRGDQPAE